jgi:hypothetical protein
MKPEKPSYCPSPQDVGDIVLSEDLTALSETLAENTHEVWAQARFAEGWRYGEQRNDVQKLHPCLVPYPELPESEKEYDRLTSLNTLRLVGKLGFLVLKKAPYVCPVCGADVAVGMDYCPQCGGRLLKG